MPGVIITAVITAAALTGLVFLYAHVQQLRKKGDPKKECSGNCTPDCAAGCTRVERDISVPDVGSPAQEGSGSPAADNSENSP